MGKLDNYEVEGQMGLFDYIEDTTSEDKNYFATMKPIRLIELFSGIGSQAMALRDLGISFEHYRTSEWDVNAILSYYAIHCSDDKTDYSEGFNFNEVVSCLDDWGISADGKNPLTREKVTKKGEKWCRKLFNAMVATKDIGSVSNATGEDLGIEDKDKYTYLLTYSFPCFTGDTKVITKDGLKRIDEITTSDDVIVNGKAYEVVKQKCTGRYEKIIEVIFDDGFKCRCTPEHLFLTLGKANGLPIVKWSCARDLLGAQVMLGNGDVGKLSKVVKIKDAGRADVYDITVMHVHAFCLENGAIVHNCTDLSLAGKMRGMERGSETSSSLLWQVERLLRETEEKPDILLMENVTQVHATKNINLFEEWLGILKEMGYSSTWFDINAKDMGVPQNRDRCFCVSFLGNYDYEPPKTMELTKCMADLLEAETPEEYYINGDRARNLINNLIVEGKIHDIDSFREGVASTDSGDEL